MADPFSHGQITPGSAIDPDVFKKAEQSARRVNDLIKTLSYRKKISFEEADKERKRLDRLADALGELDKVQKKNGTLTGKQQKRFERINKLLNKQNELEKKLGKTKKKLTIEETKQEKIKEGWRKKQLRELGSFGKVIDSIRSRKGRIDEIAKTTDKIGESIYGWGGKLASSSNLMAKGSARMVRALGQTLGGVSAVLKKAGPWVAIGMEVAKFELQQDKFLKEQNKIFAQMRGPDIMTGDVKKQFKDFNDQIFKAMDNIHDGLNVKEVQQFFEAMSQAGTAVGKLNKQGQTYRDVVRVAAETSKNWGVDISYMGNVTSDLMQDYQADLTSIHELFNQVTFDAGKSGRTTDKFWTAIQNATVGLGFYGMAFKGLSKVMGEWSKKQIGGAKEVDAAVQNLGQLAKLEPAAALGVVGLARAQGYDWKETVDIEIKKAAEEKKTASPERQAVIGLREEMLKKIKFSLDTGDTDDAMKNLALYFGDFADQMPGIARSIVAGSKDLWIAIQAGKQFGMSDDLIRMLWEQGELFKKSLGNISEVAKKPVTIDKSILEALKPGTDEETQERGISALKDLLVPIFGDNAEALAKLAAADPEILKALQDGSMPTAIDKLLKNDVLLVQDMNRMDRREGMTSKMMGARSKATFAQMRDQTLSWEEMIAMGMDEFQYWTANIAQADHLNTLVTKILGAVTTDKSLGTEAENKKEQNALLALGVQSEMYTVGGQTAAFKDIVDKLDILKNLTPEKLSGMNEEQLKAIYSKFPGAPGGPAEQFQHGMGELVSLKKEGDAEKIKEQIKAILLGLPTLQAGLQTAKEGIGGKAAVQSTLEKKPMDIDYSYLGGGATMREPRLITSPGFMKLDPGELLQPGNFARTTLATMPSVPGRGLAEGTGGKTITVNVNATERDLATRIGNEVRSVLFKERVN